MLGTPEGEIGYFGANGFTESKTEVKAFGEFVQFAAWCPVGSYNPMLLFQTQNSIYQINFDNSFHILRLNNFPLSLQIRFLK